MTKNGGQVWYRRATGQGLGVGETQSSRPISNWRLKLRVPDTQPCTATLFYFSQKVRRRYTQAHLAFFRFQDNTFKRGRQLLHWASLITPFSQQALPLAFNNVGNPQISNVFIVIRGMLISGQISTHTTKTTTHRGLTMAFFVAKFFFFWPCSMGSWFPDQE